MKRILLIISLSEIFAYGVNTNNIYLKSYNYEKMSDFSDAVKVLVPLYKKTPNQYFINLRLAWLFFLDKKYKNAIKHYKKALIVVPSSVEANLGLIKSYLNLRDANSAIQVGNIILKNDLYNFYGNYYLILALKQKHNYTQALKLTRKMLSLYPTSIIYLEQLANLLSKKDINEAKKVYQNILILDPNNVTAKQYLFGKSTH